MINTQKLTDDQTLEIGIRMMVIIATSLSLASTPQSEQKFVERRDVMEKYIKGAIK